MPPDDRKTLASPAERPGGTVLRHLTAGGGTMLGRLARLAMVCGLCAAPATALAGTEAAVLRDGATIAGTLDAPGTTKTYRLVAPVGAYVEGRLTADSGAFDVHLLDGTRTPWRRLLEDAGGRSTFRFIATAPDLALQVTARSGGAFALELTRVVPAEAQVAPGRTYLSPTIARLADTVAAGGGTEAFWQEVARQGTPLVEPHGETEAEVVLTFLVRGARRNARLVGGPSNDHEWMERLGESDVWFKSFVVPASTRVAYRIAPDVPRIPGSARDRRRALLAVAQSDPYNTSPWPATAPDRFNQESLVELPAAPVEPGVEGCPTRHGSVERHRFVSPSLDNERNLDIYTPVGFDPKDPETVLLVLFDGDSFRDLVDTPQILDSLIEQGRLPPVVAAFVGNAGAEARATELPDSPAFATAMAEEVVPFVAQATGLTPRPARTILAGASYGGLAATRIALAHPDTFGNALSMSGSFWWHPEDTAPEHEEYTARKVATSPTQPVRVHLTAGLFEVGRYDETVGILESSRHLRDVLEAKGYTVSYREYASAHGYLAWRGALGDGLLALVGTAAVAEDADCGGRP